MAGCTPTTKHSFPMGIALFDEQAPDCSPDAGQERRQLRQNKAF